MLKKGSWGKFLEEKDIFIDHKKVLLKGEGPMKERKDIPLKDTWDLTTLYEVKGKWEAEFQQAKKNLDEGCKKIIEGKGKLYQSDILKAILQEYFDFSQLLERLYTYAHLKADEDTVNEENKIQYHKVLSLFYQFKHVSSFVEPEILHLPEPEFHALLTNPSLDLFHSYLKKLFDQKAHVLPKEQEELLSLGGMALQSPSKAFSAFNNADIRFEEVKDSKGETHELSHGLYQLYLKSSDRQLRQESFTSMHSAYLSHQFTLCELLSGHVESHVFNMKTRKFSSSLEAALFPYQIHTDIYHTLIDTVGKNLSSLHRYVALRKKWMKLSKIHIYDLYTPIFSDVHYEVNYEKACGLVIESLTPLGSEYQNVLEQGLSKQRWVDIYENKNKRSGAYSSGCYESYPYILLNFHGTMSDLMTLSHEAGHSMHSYYSNKHQPYPYASYSIFLAEIASTFHEELTFRHLLKQAVSKEEKIFLINQKIDGMRATFFRQTMFAEFELMIHRMAESSIPLTPQVVRDHYLELNKKYFGPEFEPEELLSVEFLRIPHFYSNFYVYQYATGIAAAHAFAKNVIEKGKKEDYIKFISSGSYYYPVDLLQQVGIQMKSPQVYLDFIKEFDGLLDELEALVQN